MPCTPEGYYTALLAAPELIGAAKYACVRGAHEDVETKIEIGLRLRVAHVHDKVRPIAPTGRAEGVRGTNAKDR